MESGASGFFFTNDAHKKNVDPTTPHIQVGTASVQLMTSAGTCEIFLPQLSSDFFTIVHFMTGFQ